MAESNQIARRFKTVAIIAGFTSLLTYVLIVWGGMVFNTGSSMACPDWPLCFGMIFPPMQGGIFFEHTHRILGTLVGICSIVLCWRLWAPCPPFASMQRLGAAVLGLVIIQGLLGGMIVKYNLPPLVRMAHLGTSMLVLLMMLTISRAAWLRARGARDLSGSGDVRIDTRGVPALRGITPLPAASANALLLAITFGAVYLQMLLGALVRHTGATYALRLGWSGSFVPVDPATYKPMLWPPTAPAEANALHRYIAIALALLVAYAGARAFVAARAAGRRMLAALCWAPLVLVLAQIAVGVVMIGTTLDVVARTAHLAVAALLLANLFVLLLCFREGRGGPAMAPAADPAPAATSGAGGQAGHAHPAPPDGGSVAVH